MKPSKAFTLVELLTVVSIIALLVSIMLPAFGQARYQAKNVVDMSNLRQVGLAARQWSDDHDDWSLPPNWYVDEDFAEITGVEPFDPYKPGATFSERLRDNLYVCPIARQIEFFGVNPPDIISYGINGSITKGGREPTYYVEGIGWRYLTGSTKLSTVKEPVTTNHFMCHEKWIVMKDVNFNPAVDPKLLPDPTRSRWHRIPSGEFYGVSNIAWLDGHVSVEPDDFAKRWRHYLHVD